MCGVVYILLYCVLYQSSFWLPDFNKLLVLPGMKYVEGLWGLVNNAALNLLGDAELTTMDQYINQVNINQLGVVRVTKAFLPEIRRRKGFSIARVCLLLYLWQAVIKKHFYLDVSVSVLYYLIIYVAEKLHNDNVLEKLHHVLPLLFCYFACYLYYIVQKSTLMWY